MYRNGVVVLGRPLRVRRVATLLWRDGLFRYSATVLVSPSFPFENAVLSAGRPQLLPPNVKKSKLKLLLLDSA